MTKARRPRSLWPREHGAYAQLAAPLVTALVVRPPTWVAGVLALAAVLAFLANEPLLVVLGHRGRRMRELEGGRAARRLAVLLTCGLAAAGSALLFAEPVVLAMAGVVAIPAAITVVLAFRREERSLLGECMAAISLSGASAPVLVASGASWQSGAALWAAWAIGYCSTVIAVHRVIARHKAEATWRDTLALLLLAAVSAVAITLAARSSPIGAAAPLAIASFVLVAKPPKATYLRTIGFVLVGASLATGALAWAML